jgi:hypothetical protein
MMMKPSGHQLVVTRTQVAPGLKAVFQFQPRIWIGVVSQVGQGEVLNSAIGKRSLNLRSPARHQPATSGSTSVASCANDSCHPR